MPPFSVVSPPHLYSLTYDKNRDSFHLFVDMGDFHNSDGGAIRQYTGELLKLFLVGVTLPNQTFWVNLRPDDENRMLDNDLAKTDAGRILLEADLELKKEIGRLTSPSSPLGSSFWKMVNKKAEEIYGDPMVSIPVYGRVWIVPGEIVLCESANNASVYKATLTVLNESEYLRENRTFEDKRFQQLSDFSSSLVKSMILPQLIKSVNTSEKYAALRQVYYSFILAQWFKARFKNKKTEYTDIIDARCLQGLQSAKNWDKGYYFRQYQKSYKQGEYNKSETVVFSNGEMVKNYFFGGISLTLPSFSYPGSATSDSRLTIIQSRFPRNIPGVNGGRHIVDISVDEDGMLINNGSPQATVDRFSPPLNNNSSIMDGGTIASEGREKLVDFGVFTWQKMRPYLSVVQYILAYITALAAPFLLPILLYPQYFLYQFGKSLSVVQQWGVVQQKSDTLMGFSSDLLNFKGITNASYREMKTLAQRIVEVNSEVKDWDIIRKGNTYIIPPEYVSPKLINKLNLIKKTAAGAVVSTTGFIEMLNPAEASSFRVGSAPATSFHAASVPATSFHVDSAPVSSFHADPAPASSLHTGLAAEHLNTPSFTEHHVSLPQSTGVHSGQTPGYSFKAGPKPEYSIKAGAEIQGSNVPGEQKLDASHISYHPIHRSPDTVIPESAKPVYRSPDAVIPESAKPVHRSPDAVIPESAKPVHRSPDAVMPEDAKTVHPIHSDVAPVHPGDVSPVVHTPGTPHAPVPVSHPADVPPSHPGVTVSPDSPGVVPHVFNTPSLSPINTTHVEHPMNATNTTLNQTNGFQFNDLSQLAGQFMHTINDFGVYAAGIVRTNPEILALFFLGAGFFAYCYYTWTKSKKVKQPKTVIVSNPDTWENGTTATLKGLKYIINSMEHTDTDVIYSSSLALEEVRKLRNALPFNVSEVTNRRSKYAKVYSQVMPELRTLIGILFRKSRESRDETERRQLKVFSAELLDTYEYFNVCKHLLHAVENIPWASGDRFDHSRFSNHIMSTFVGSLVGFNMIYNRSVNSLKKNLREVIIPLGNKLDNIYPQESTRDTQTIGEWDSWIYDAYNGSKSKLGAKRTWPLLREMVTPAIALVAFGVLAFYPFLINLQILIGGDSTALMPVIKGASAPLALIAAWYVSINAMTDSDFKNNTREIKKLKAELNKFSPPLSDNFQDEAAHITYDITMDSVSRELSSSEKSAEAVIVVTDQPHKIQRHLDNIRGILLRRDVPVVLVPVNGAGSAGSFIKGMVESKKYKRCIVLLGAGKDVDRSLVQLPLPQFPGLGRSLTSLELALANGYQVTQVLKERNENRVWVDFIHKVFLGDIKSILKGRRINDIELLTSLVDIKQMETQNLGLIAMNGNGKAIQNKIEGHIGKLFQGVTKNLIKDKFAPAYFTGEIFDWNNNTKKQMPIFAGGVLVKADHNFLTLLSQIQNYIDRNKSFGFKTHFTSHLLVPLVMLANGEGKDIHRYRERLGAASEEESKFYEGLFNIYWPHYSKKGYCTDFDKYDIGAFMPYSQGATYVKLDGTRYAEHVLKHGLHGLYSEKEGNESMYSNDQGEESLIANVSFSRPLRHSMGSKQKDLLDLSRNMVGSKPGSSSISSRGASPRTTFNAETRRGKIRDFINNNEKGEFTVRDILKEVFIRGKEKDIPPSYITIYRDLEILMGKEGFLTKERKQDPADKKSKNFYRLATLGGKLKSSEGGSLVSDGKIEMPLLSTPGGIDFRKLQITILPDKSGVQRDKQDFETAWMRIRHGMETGKLPKVVQVKKLFDLARNYRHKEQALSKVRDCVAEILRMEEKMMIPTDAALIDILVDIESFPVSCVQPQKVLVP